MKNTPIKLTCFIRACIKHIYKVQRQSVLGKMDLSTNVLYDQPKRE